MDSATIVAIVGALFGAGGIAAIFKAQADNKKTRAEAEITLTGGWQILYETSRAEVNELRERVAIIEARESDCRKRLSQLETQGGVDIEKKVSKLINDEIEKLEVSAHGGGNTGGAQRT